MDTNLIQETIRFLQQEVAADASIRVEFDETPLNEMASLLQSYDLERTRKLAIFSCCLLLQLASQRHQEITLDDNRALTRSILDGDYLLGLYFRILMRFNELKLLAHLSPLHKKIQIGAIHGQSMEQLPAELMEQIKMFLNEQSKYRAGGDSDEAA
jgi:hypothetical protein